MITNNEELKMFWDKSYVNIQSQIGCLDSVRDVHFAELESKALIKAILNSVNPAIENRVLEIGCGSGELLNKVRNELSQGVFEGVDLSEIVETGKAKFPDIALTRGDAFDYLKKTNCKYDVIYTRRVIINFLTPEKQYDFFDLAYNLLNENGVLIIEELFSERLSNHNEIRKQFGLSEYNISEHIIPLNENEIIQRLGNKFQFEGFEYLNTYMLICYILYPFLVKEVVHNSEIHRISANLPDAGSFSPFKGLILKKCYQ